MNQIKAITIVENEPYLRKISSPIQFDDKDLFDHIKTLEKYCQSNAVRAMAAIQLGIPKRLVYIKNTSLEIKSKLQTDHTTEEEIYNEASVLINPVIISKEGLTEYWEACVSCLDNMGLVKRPYKMVVAYYDVNQNKHLDTFEGFESTVLSHEMDHLDGILHMDIAEEILQMPVEERKQFRQQHGYHIISKHGDYETLLHATNIQ